MDDVQGGTFTITNLGVFGCLFGTPMINPPQVAVLGIGTIEKRPVVRDDAIAIRTMAYVALTFDHRIVDGSDADRFMAQLKKACSASTRARCSRTGARGMWRAIASISANSGKGPTRRASSFEACDGRKHRWDRFRADQRAKAEKGVKNEAAGTAAPQLPRSPSVVEAGQARSQEASLASLSSQRRRASNTMTSTVQSNLEPGSGTMPFTYLLECADGTLYTGWTLDLERRVDVHNRGLGARYTRSRLPVRLVYAEEHATATLARKREYELRNLPRRAKLDLAAGYRAGEGTFPNQAVLGTEQ